MTAQPVTPFRFKDLPEGTVTFLFSDIEGSTQLLYRLGDRFKATLAEHHRILREAAAHGGGHVVGIEGDSFFIAFSRATNAVAAAVEAQRALAQYPWPEGAPVRVRMGLHTGEAEVALDSYVGIAVHRAARIASAGHGGQVLLSEPTTALVGDELPAGVRLLDLGRHLLKDIHQPERICQLCIEGLRTAFPPLKTLQVQPHNLPVQLTSFIGREREMGEIKTLLPGTHLLTLTGIGGTGKTRLALQVSADLTGDFSGGVWCVELAPLSDPALVPQAVASVLGLHEQPDRSLSDLLTDHLREKHLLLILDNCEHVLEACAQLAGKLLQGAPKLKILATSRVPLNVTGETTYPVPPLSLPDPHQTPPLLTLTQYEAVRLFIDRALAVQPRFSVTKANAPAVAQICQHLDGIPLAVELAAARVRLLSPDQISSRLGDRFSLLTGGGRTALPRQQTLRATMDWSYDLLAEAERVLFNRLAVFAGGFSLEAVEAVGTDEGSGGACEPAISSSQVLDLLGTLVAHSLVVVREMKGETRYDLLETVRQYALERLQASGEWPTLQDRHLAYYQRLAEQGESHTWAGRPAWMDRFEMEIDNFRAAVDRALASNPESAILLAKSLDMFVDLTSRNGEWNGWIVRILAFTESWPASRLKAIALSLAGIRAVDVGEHQRARDLLEASLEMAGEVGDKDQVVHRLYDLAVNSLLCRDWALARQYAEREMAVARELGDNEFVANALFQLGEVAWRSGDTETGRRLFEQALEMSRQENLPNSIAFGLSALARFARLEGDNAKAKACYMECAQIRRQMGFRTGLANALINLGQVALQEGDVVQSKATAEESLAILRDLRVVSDQVYCLAGFAGVAALAGQDERAARLFGAAEAAAETLDLKMDDLDHMAYDPLIAAVRQRLGEASFNAAWAAGRAMTLEQALECAQQ